MLTDEQLKKYVTDIINGVPLPTNKVEFADLMIFIARDIERLTRHGIERQIQAVRNAISNRVDVYDMLERQ